MRIACSGLLILLALPAGIASAQQPPQQQTDSIAEAARRSRELKKEQAKPAKVWDNDTMPVKLGGVNVVGPSAPSGDAPGNQPAASAQTTAGAPESSAPKSSAKSGKDIKALQASLAAAKDQLQLVKTEVDILQRKYNLDSQMYYGKPNYAADTDGAAKLADEKSQIDAKQAEVDAAQRKVDAIETELKESGAGSDSSTPKTK
jgi:hypothetical protein